MEHNKERKIICSTCHRQLPDSSFLYKNECLWCSAELFEKQLKIKEKQNVADQKNMGNKTKNSKN